MGPIASPSQPAADEPLAEQSEASPAASDQSAVPAVAAVAGTAGAQPPISEANTAALRQPLTCEKCGHVTPYIEGWMMAAAMHHISAVHGRDVAALAEY